MSLEDWLPPTLAPAPRTADSRLTGVRIPYDYATASRVVARGDGGTWDARLRYRHAEDVVIWHDRDRLIDEARD